MNSHMRLDLEVLHVLRRNQDVLFPVGSFGSVRLVPEVSTNRESDSKTWAYHHLHTDATIDSIHEHIKLVWNIIRIHPTKNKH